MAAWLAFAFWVMARTEPPSKPLSAKTLMASSIRLCRVRSEGRVMAALGRGRFVSQRDGISPATDVPTDLTPFMRLDAEGMDGR